MINKDKKYRYNNGEKAIILTVERPVCSEPIISMDAYGRTRFHSVDGRCCPYYPDYTLVEVGAFDHINEGDLVEIEVGSLKTIRVFCGVNSYGHAMVRSWSSDKLGHTAEECRLLVRKEDIIEEDDCGI